MFSGFAIVLGVFDVLIGIADALVGVCIETATLPQMKHAFYARRG